MFNLDTPVPRFRLIYLHLHLGISLHRVFQENILEIWLTYIIISTTCICIISADLRCIEPSKGKPRCSADLTAGLLSPGAVTWAGAASQHHTVPPPDVRAFPGAEQRDATFVVSSPL